MIGNSSAIRYRRIREVTTGTRPATSMTILPTGDGKFSAPVQREQPQNVTSHRQPEDNPATNIEISAQCNSDALLDVYDEIREEAFGSVHTATVAITGTDIAAVVAGNMLQRTAGWGAMGSDSLVWVSGLTQFPNGTVMLLGTIAGNDAPVVFPTLTAQAAGTSITVAHVGQLTLGEQFLTATWEEFNTKTSKGREINGVGISSFGFEVPHPSSCKFNWAAKGMKQPTRLTAALVNASVSSPSRRVINSNTNIGDKTTTGSGMRFRYNGALLTTLRVTSLKFTLENPKATYGEVGEFGPTDIADDGEMNIGLEMTCYRTGADIDTLEADADNPNAEVNFGFGVRDPAGNRDYLYFSRLHPSNGDPSGRKKQGAETVDFKFMGAFHALHSAIRWARLMRA